MITQSAVESAVRSPNFWALSLTVSFLTAVTLTWGLLGRISARFNKALEDKIRPLLEKIESQGTNFGNEAVRLERHFDESIKEVERRNKEEITAALAGVRQEMKAFGQRQQDVMLKVNTNSTTLSQHREDYQEFKQESKMDRQQMRRDVDSQQRQLTAIDVAQEKAQERIIEAINGAKDKLSDAQGNLSIRLTRVEEALKFWSSIRVDEERSGP